MRVQGHHIHTLSHIVSICLWQLGNNSANLLNYQVLETPLACITVKNPFIYRFYSSLFHLI